MKDIYADIDDIGLNIQIFFPDETNNSDKLQQQLQEYLGADMHLFTPEVHKEGYWGYQTETKDKTVGYTPKDADGDASLTIVQQLKKNNVEKGIDSFYEYVKGIATCITLQDGSFSAISLGILLYSRVFFKLDVPKRVLNYAGHNVSVNQDSSVSFTGRYREKYASNVQYSRREHTKTKEMALLSETNIMTRISQPEPLDSFMSAVDIQDVIGGEVAYIRGEK